MAVPVELEIFMKDLTKAGLQSVGKNVDDVENQTLQLISALKQVIAEQKHQLEVNKAAGLSYTQEAANIQALTGQINGLKAGLKDLQKTKEDVSKTPSIDIDTEAVTRKTNNLKTQFSQVARELPSLAMGPQMFILAISNNLPMLADAISDVRKQNELLAASGQKGVPVWKQLAGAVFSWQTALVAAISLGIVFGKDIANWVKELISGKKAIDNNKEALENYKKAMLDSQQAAQEEIVQLNLLYQAAVDSSKGMNERISAVKELKKEFPQYFKNLSDEEVLVGKAADKYNELATAIMASAKAQAAKETLIKNSKEILDLESKITEEYKKQELNEVKRTEAVGKLKEGQNRTFLPVSNDVIDAVNRDYDRFFNQSEEKITEWRKKIYDLTKFNKSLVDQVNIEDLLFESDGGDNTNKKEKTDYASQLADARVKAQQTTEKLRLQIMQEGIEKRKALAKQEYDEQLADIDKQERDTIAKMDKARKQGDNIPQSQYDDVKNKAKTNRILAEQVYNEQIFQIEQEYRNKSSQALIDYYEEYGTYQEKRLAIAQDYARKIAAAETEGERLALGEERDKKIQSLDYEELKKGMDWDKIFGDLDKVSTDTLENLREKLKQYLEGIGEDISPESFKEVMDAFKDIDSELADRSPFEAMKKGYEDYMSAMQEVRAAENLLQQTQMGGNVIVEEYDEATGEVTRKLITQAEAEERLRNAQDKRTAAQKTLTQAANSIGQKGEAVVSAGNDIVDMLESLGVEVPEAMKGVLTGLGTVMSSLASIDLTKPFSILTGITGTLKGIGQTIGGLFGLSEGSTARYEELKAVLEEMNEIYDKILSKQKDMISFGGGFAAINAANEAMDTLNRQIDNYRQLAQAAGEAGSGAFKHSYAYRSNEGIGASGFQQISDLLGKDIRAVQDLYSLSGDELFEIMSKLPDIWYKVNGNIRQYLEQIAEAKDETGEIADMLNEALTGVTRDSFYNDFIDGLADMSMSWEDMCDNFETQLRKSILAGLVSSEYQQRIQDLYNKWSEAAKSDGEISEKEAEQLRNEYQQIVQDLMKQRDEMAEAFGWESSSSGSSQSPSSGALTTMSQDSISTFEAIGRNMQTHLANTDKFVQEIRNTQKLDSQTLATIASHTAYIVLIYDLMEDLKLNGIQLK
jgi:hypothetical protein